MRTFYLYSPLALQTFIWPITRPLFRFFIRLEIHGIENLEKLAFTDGRRQMLKNRIIFAVNHSSELDPILVPASLPFLSPFMPFFYTSRESAFYKTSGWRQFFYGGFFFKLWGAHPVRAGRQNYEESLATHIDILDKGRSVCIFPEGRTTQDGNIGREAHGGVAYLSWRTGALVVPVRIKGVFKMTLRDFLCRKRWVSVTFGAPLLPSELFTVTDEAPSLDGVKSAANRVLEAIRGL